MAPPGVPAEVVVHPLVLLSVVDHYNRMSKGVRLRNKRVVGVLLGETFKGRVDVSNSFAVPFEEDAKDPSIWYLDHNFLEQMYSMFKKVNAKERIVGFYSTGPKIRQNDIMIDVMMRKYCSHPVFVIIDVDIDAVGIPTQAYYSVEQVDESKTTTRTFENVPSEVGAYEAEEVGVEHLLRDINDPTVSTLASRVQHKLTGLHNLKSKLESMQAYLRNVAAGKMPLNNQVVYNLQDIFNLLPNLNLDALVKAFVVKTNDMHLAIYVASLIRAVLALHTLVANKDKLQALEEAKIESAEEQKAKESAAADGKKPQAEAGGAKKDSDMKDA